MRAPALLLAAAVCSVCVLPVQAQVKTWNYSGTDSWATDARWDPWGMPGPFDEVVVDQGQPVIDAAGLFPCLTLGVGTYAFTFGQVDLLQGDLQAAQEWVGNEGNGQFTHLGGSNFVWDTGGLSLGDKATGFGTYYLDGVSSALYAPTIRVGNFGAGYLDQHGGQVGTDTLRIAADAAAFGRYWLRGGTLDVTGGISGLGDGMLVIDGGTLDTHGSAIVVPQFWVGADPGASGAYTHSAGTLTAQGMTIGLLGTGLFTHTGGTVTVDTPGLLSIGAAAGGHGTYELSGVGSVLNAKPMVGSSGGVGVFNQNGGILDCYSYSIGAGGTGTYNLYSGYIEAAAVYLGRDAGTGTFNQYDGLHDLHGDQDLYIAHGPSSVGTYNLFGGTLDVGYLDVGCGGTGLFSHTGGRVDVGYSLVVGHDATGEGTYVLSGTGVLQVQRNETIGDSGKGTFNHSAGTHTLTSEFKTLYLGGGPNGEGTYNLSGTGVLTVPNLTVGEEGTGTFSQTGGRCTVTDTLTVGQALGSSGACFLGAGGVLNTATVYVGYDGVGTFTQTGGTHAVATALVLGQMGKAGTYSLEGGSLSAAQVDLKFGGTFSQTGGALAALIFNQSGGTVSGRLENRGTFNYSAGTFSGRLINLGTVNFLADFTAGDGIENYTSLCVPVGRTLSLGGVGLLNAGTLTLDGGVLNGPGPVTNDFGGWMTAKGTVATDFFNNGALGLAGLLSISGAAANAGTVTVNATQNFQAAGPLTNSGTLTLNRGAIVAASLFNGPGGIIEGAGGITAPVTNSGGLIHASGTTPLVISSLAGGNTGGGEIWVENAATLSVGTPFANAGTIRLKGDTATLACGTVANSGTIRGQGRLTGAVANSGVVRAEGGQLTLAGAGNTNAAGGRIEVLTNATVFFPQGLAINAGTIVLTGATFDNSIHTLVNNGTITGHGTLRTGGLTNSPGKIVGVGAGNLDVFGTVDNDGTWTTQSGCTTTFYDFVHGEGSFPGPGGTVVFLAGYSPGGSPAEIAFGGDVVLGGANALLMELAGRTPGDQYDTLDVAGTLALGGTLEVALLDGFAPRAGDVFDLFDWGGLTGTFGAIDLPTLPDGLAWDTGSLYATGQVGVVPEPATLALAALGAAAIASSRRRRRMARPAKPRPIRARVAGSGATPGGRSRFAPLVSR